MKKIFKKNQMIITVLAVMIAAAGYISYSDTKVNTTETASKIHKETINEEIGEEELEEPQDEAEMETAADGTWEDIENLEKELTDVDDSVTEVPGEAILTGASTYMAQAKIGREQIRSQNKETLLGIINNPQLSEKERQEAVATMVNMTELVEKEAAAELLLEAKGFPGIVVNLTGETADIVVPMEQVQEAQRAQIEDIVTRKTGIAPESIVITPVKKK